MKDNYCIMNVDEQVWEVCVLSLDGNLIYPTNVFFEAKNEKEAIEIADSPIDLHKELWNQTGCVALKKGILMKNI